LIRRLIVGATAVALSIGAVYGAAGFCGRRPALLIEVGRSMPRGLYVYRHDIPARVGEVIVRMDPPGFEQPWLMKQVAGTAGALFCWRPDLNTHELDGRLMPQPHPLASSLGLTPWPGCRVLERGEVVGYGRSADSYDSRYLGPVREERLAGVYRLVVPMDWLASSGGAPDRGAHQADLLGAEGGGGRAEATTDLGRQGEGGDGRLAGR
jgi:type IV secretory pathway protease TraF